MTTRHVARCGLGPRSALLSLTLLVLAPLSADAAQGGASVRGLTRDYPQGTHTVHALQGVDLDIEEGEFLKIDTRTGEYVARARD